MVVVRYGCDGCNRLFENQDSLTVVEVRYYVSGDATWGSRDREEMLCEECMRGRDTPTSWQAPDLGMMTTTGKRYGIKT